MINPKRVRRIKNVIYAMIILLLFVPAVIVIILGVQLLGALGPLNDYLANASQPNSSVVENADNESGGDSGYVLGAQPPVSLPGGESQVADGATGDGGTASQDAPGQGEGEAGSLPDDGDASAENSGDGAAGSDGAQAGAGTTGAGAESAAGTAASGAPEVDNPTFGSPSVPNVQNPETGMPGSSSYRLLFQSKVRATGA